MNTFAYLAGFLCQLSFSSQVTQEVTLAKYLLSNAEGEQGELNISRIVAYFQRRYNENFVNLLTEYNAVFSQLFSNHQSIWISRPKEIAKKFHPEVSLEWLQLECESLILLAKEVLSSYQIIFRNSNQEISSDSNMQAGERRIESSLCTPSLPPKLALMNYSKLLEFFDRIDFIEQVWADMTLLYALLGVGQPALTDVTQRILELFGNNVVTENITSLPVIFVSNLGFSNFDIELLIRNPVLFPHFNSLSSAELVFVLRHVSAINDIDLRFLEAVVRLPEIRERLLSSDYVKMATCLPKIKKKEKINPKKAAVILSMPEIIEQLTDKDLLKLMGKLPAEISQLLLDNIKLKNRMTGNLWFDLMKKNCLFEDVVSQDKEIYSLFSSQQLKCLVLDKFQEKLLEDEGVFSKLNGVFTVREIETLTFNNPPSVVERVSRLTPKNISISFSGYSASYSNFSQYGCIVRNEGIKSTLMSEINIFPSEGNLAHNKFSPGEPGELNGAIEYILVGANMLLFMGAATGVATFFLPYMLSVAIGFLGAALLAFSAYGLMVDSRYGFFSASDGLVADSLSLQKRDCNEEMHARYGKP
jgi:hypothetical protein